MDLFKLQFLMFYLMKILPWLTILQLKEKKAPFLFISTLMEWSITTTATIIQLKICQNGSIERNSNHLLPSSNALHLAGNIQFSGLTLRRMLGSSTLIRFSLTSSLTSSWTYRSLANTYWPSCSQRSWSYRIGRLGWLLSPWIIH